MIKITFITLGKLKEDYLRKAVDEYSKRLSKYCRLDIIELSPVFLPEKPSQSEITAALKKEAEMILSKIPQNAFVTALCIEGKGMSSESFAELIQKNTDSGTPMCFIIGSSCGLGGDIKQRANLRLSVSEMTFPHQLFRVMLLEQIYRGFKINEGSAYHK